MDSQARGLEQTVSSQALTVITDVAPAAEIRVQEIGELLRCAQAGDRAALDQLIERLTPLVWNVARAQGLGKESAAGAVQASWVAFVKDMHLISSSEALTDWLVLVTRRNARAMRTTQHPTELIKPGNPTHQPDPSATDPDLTNLERYQCLRDNLQKLSPTCQELLRILAFTQHTTQRAIPNQCLNELKILLQNDPQWNQDLFHDPPHHVKVTETRYAPR